MPSLRDALHSVGVFARAGLLRPSRPDRLWRAARELRYWGTSLATGFATVAARYPERVALVDERGTLTWAEVDRRSNALARGLAAGGIREDDTAAVMCRNHRGMVDATAALAKLGAHTLYLNTGFSAPQLRDVLEREGAHHLLVDEEFLPLLDAGGTSAKSLFVAWADGKPDAPTFDELIASHGDSRPAAPPIVSRTIILTSGTTGTPRGAARHQVSGVGPLVAMLDRIPYRTGEIMVIAAPMFHAWGFGNFSVGLLLGNTNVLLRRFDPEEALAAIARNRATALCAVPVMLQRILELPPEVRRRYDCSSLRLVPLSGSSLPGHLAPRFMDEFGDVVYNFYGSTEVGYATVATPQDLRAEPATAGRPPAGTVVKILDEEGREVGPGATGRIFVGSEALFDGYTDGGSKSVIDGLMATGDTGHFDAGGLLFVEGRDDEMIVSGGENVFPREVEDLLALHPGVADVAVIGVPDDHFGTRLKAFVVPRPDSEIDSEDVKDYVRSNLARYKVPRDIEFVAVLPRNTTGKILKRELS